MRRQHVVKGRHNCDIGTRKRADRGFVLARSCKSMSEIAAREASSVDPPLLFLGHELKVAAAGRLRSLDDPIGDFGNGRVESHDCPLFVPADPVTFSECDCRRRSPGSRSIRPWDHGLFGPGCTDPVDKGPLRLDFIAADEQGRVAFDQIKKQPFVGNPSPIFAKGIGHSDIERDFAKANALAVEARESWPSTAIRSIPQAEVR